MRIFASRQCYICYRPRRNCLVFAAMAPQSRQSQLPSPSSKNAVVHTSIWVQHNYQTVWHTYGLYLWPALGRALICN